MACGNVDSAFDNFLNVDFVSSKKDIIFRGKKFASVRTIPSIEKKKRKDFVLERTIPPFGKRLCVGRRSRDS